MSNKQVVLSLIAMVLFVLWVIVNIVGSFGVEWACRIAGAGGIGQVPANCIKFFMEIK